MNDGVARGDELPARDERGPIPEHGMGSGVDADGIVEAGIPRVVGCGCGAARLAVLGARCLDERQRDDEQKCHAKDGAELHGCSLTTFLLPPVLSLSRQRW
ncbi:MAG: hypothetical protein U0166_11435 [Acidobacteriota bacterium]